MAPTPVKDHIFLTPNPSHFAKSTQHRWKDQGDHLSGKPGNVRDFTKSHGSIREKILSRKK